MCVYKYTLCALIFRSVVYSVHKRCTPGAFIYMEAARVIHYICLTKHFYLIFSIYNGR